VRTRVVDWRDMPADLGRFDVVLASDVLYERPYAALVAGAIAATLAPGGFALVADPGRVAAPDFDREAAALGLAVEQVARVPFEMGAIRQHIDIRRLRRESFSP
jgi:ETFB lysine methyltransferase